MECCKPPVVTRPAAHVLKIFSNSPGVVLFCMSVRFMVRGEQLELELVCACSATPQQLLVLMSKNSSVFHIFNTVSRFYLDCAEVSFKRFVPCCQAIVITRQITPLRAFPPRLFSTKTQRAVVAPTATKPSTHPSPSEGAESGCCCCCCCTHPPPTVARLPRGAATPDSAIPCTVWLLDALQLLFQALAAK